MSRFGAIKKTKFLLLLLLIMLGMSQSGCSTLSKAWSALGFGGSSQAKTAEVMVMEGLDNYNHGEYKKALKIFEEIKDRFPFTENSLLAELKAADCHYYLEEYVEARTLYEEFENNHPTNEAVPYVMFQIGMCYYQQIDTIDRDPGSALDAIKAFSRLVQNFPQSPYTVEAQARIIAAQNFLANHEMYVANFYVRTEEYTQAEGRLEYLLANYPNTEVAPKAKELLAALKAGNPPERSWLSWLPDISLPSWKSFVSSVTPGVPGTTPNSGGPGGGGPPE